MYIAGTGYVFSALKTEASEESARPQSDTGRGMREWRDCAGRTVPASNERYYRYKDSKAGMDRFHQVSASLFIGETLAPSIAP
jgi:hypothetical protein